MLPLMLKLHFIDLSDGGHSGSLCLLEDTYCDHSCIKVGPTFNPLRPDPESELLDRMVTGSQREDVGHLQMVLPDPAGALSPHRGQGRRSKLPS